MELISVETKVNFFERTNSEYDMANKTVYEDVFNYQGCKLLLYVDNYIMLETLKTFYEWERWEGIMHQILFLLVIYIVYVFIVNSKERTLLNLLFGKGLIRLNVEGRKINIGLTDAGIAVANKIAGRREYADMVCRSSALKSHFDMTATGLMRFIYDTFPEILSLRSDQEIKP